MKNANVSLVLILFLVCGCATISAEDIPTLAERQDFEPLKIELAYELYGLRIDVRRQTTTTTTTTTDSKGNTVTQTQTVNVPYHYIGVDLGNGLFLDANGNLSLNILSLLGKSNRDDFAITQKSTGLLSRDIVYEKNSDLAIVKRGGLAGTTEITVHQDGATFHGGFLKSEQDIIVKEDEIIYDPHGIFGSWSIARVEKTPDGARVPNFWKDGEIIFNSSTEVELSTGLVLSNSGTSLELIFSGLFGMKSVFTMVRSGGKIAFFNEAQNHGFVVEISDNQIIYRRGRFELIYLIEG